jgi:hypothetical protein
MNLNTIDLQVLLAVTMFVRIEALGKYTSPLCKIAGEFRGVGSCVNFLEKEAGRNIGLLTKFWSRNFSKT